MLRYDLAYRLHKDLAEIDAMNWEEVVGWIAYFNLENDSGS